MRIDSSLSLRMTHPLIILISRVIAKYEAIFFPFLTKRRGCLAITRNDKQSSFKSAQAQTTKGAGQEHGLWVEAFPLS